jgi:hypothetical protein
MLLVGSALAQQRISEDRDLLPIDLSGSECLDDHNGKADVGTTIESIGKNKYHHPWRSTAWAIHPVLKIEPLPDEQ